MDKNSIYLVHGTDSGKMATDLLNACDLASLIGDSRKSIVLKPNLVIAGTPENGAVTHPQIVVAVIQYLQKHGFQNIKIIEGSWVGGDTKRAFALNGYPQISRKYNVPLLDLKTDHYEKCTIAGITMEISEQALHADFLINLPVLKGHCQTRMTCALKNMKGILSDRSKRMFHTLGLHRPIAALNLARRPDFTLVDNICGDLDFEEGGNPVPTNRALAALDPVLLDSFCATQMGLSPSDIPYIGFAESLGIGSTDLSKLKLVELNNPSDNPSSTGLQTGGRVRKLEKYVNSDSACSACYANLIHALARMEEDGTLGHLKPSSICIGQGYRGKSSANSNCIGVGNCTRLFNTSVQGCPPSASAIRQVLEILQ